MTALTSSLLEGESRRVSFQFRGEAREGRGSDTVLTALWRSGDLDLGNGRGGYCLIGHCLSCRVCVDGVSAVRACLVRLREGMDVDVDDEP